MPISVVDTWIRDTRILAIQQTRRDTRRDGRESEKLSEFRGASYYRGRGDKCFLRAAFPPLEAVSGRGYLSTVSVTRPRRHNSFLGAITTRRGETRRETRRGSRGCARCCESADRTGVQQTVRAIARYSSIIRDSGSFLWLRLNRSIDPSTRYYMPPRIRCRAPRVFLRVYPSAAPILNLWYLRYRGWTREARKSSCEPAMRKAMLDQFRMREVRGACDALFVESGWRFSQSITIMKFHGNDIYSGIYVVKR